MGDVRALNVWLSLSRCGDEAPGMDVVPRRLDHIVPTGTEGAMFEWSVSEQVAEEAAGETGVLTADLRARGRAPLRRALPALDRRRAGDAQEPLGDRELVLRGLRLTRGVLAACRLSARHSRDGSSSSTCRRPAAISLYMRMQREFGEQGVYPDASDGDPVAVSPQLMLPVLLERWAARRDEIRVVTGHFPLCTTELLDADFTTFTDPARPRRAHPELPPPPPRDDPRRQRAAAGGDLRGARQTSGTSSRTTWSRCSRSRSEEMRRTRDDDGRGSRPAAAGDRDQAPCESMDAFGLQEDLEGFAQRLEQRYGWQLGPPVHENVTEPTDVPASFRQRIAEDNALDMELYEHARKLLRR